MTDDQHTPHPGGQTNRHHTNGQHTNGHQADRAAITDPVLLGYAPHRTDASSPLTVLENDGLVDPADAALGDATTAAGGGRRRPGWRRRPRRLSVAQRMFGDDDTESDGEADETDGLVDDLGQADSELGPVAYAADRGQWEDLKGLTPRGLRRSRFLDRLGWYEVHDREPAMTSTRQVVATNPALLRSQPPFTGNALGVDEQTGMYVGSDPFVLYEAGPDAVESINVVVAGDVGVGKTTLVQNHYVQNSIYAGRQVCTFDRKRNADARSGYEGVTRIVEASGKRVTRIEFDRAGNGARVNILDPRIIAKGSDQIDTVGQDELLVMVAELLHGKLTSFERFALNVAHKQARATAESEDRVPVLGDVVDALFRPNTTNLPAALHDNKHVGEADMLGYGLSLAFDLYAALDGDLSGLIDGPTRGADGEDLDLDADLILVDTSSLQDGSAALMLVMAIMASFISSVWSLSSRQSVVVIEEGYSADFPSVAAILRTLAKRGRGVGVSLLMVLHHLSDIPPGSALAALFKETGVIHLMRQAQAAEAKHTNDLLGLGDFTETIQGLAKGSHILIEGRPESRPPRIVSHVRTDMDRWANYSDAAITGGADAPTSPFPQADLQPTVLAAPEAAADSLIEEARDPDASVPTGAGQATPALEANQA